MMMVVNFALTHGMKNNDLLQELLGKVRGESSGGSSQQELIYLFNGPPWQSYDDIIESRALEHLLNYKEDTLRTRPANHIKNWLYNWLSKKCVTHEVIAVDRENKYAIIQYNRCRTRIYDVRYLAHISSSSYENPNEFYYIPSYFLCGINNDDGLYFVRPLLCVPEDLITRAKNHGDVISIVRWCNKDDLGFKGLIQGNVIFAEVEPRLCKMTINKEYIDEVIYDFTLGKKIKMYIRLDLKIHSKEKFRPCDWPHELKNLTNYMSYHFQLRHKIIGNKHELNTDGTITGVSVDKLPSEADTWSSIDLSSTFVILGSDLVICHPEHPTVKKQIPADKALLVSTQRGSGQIYGTMDD